MLDNKAYDTVVQRDDPYKKAMLAAQIVDTIDKIKRINSFDGTIWNLYNVTSNDLQRRSLAELERLQSNLDYGRNNLSQRRRLFCS